MKFKSELLKKYMLGAVAGMLLAGAPAQATIVYNDIEDITITGLTDAIYFNLETGQAWRGINDFSGGDSSGAGFSILFNNDFTQPFISMYPEIFLTPFGGGTIYTDNGTSKLAEGDLISADLPPGAGYSVSYPIGNLFEGADSPWHLGDRGFLGFQFQPSDSGVLYGWAEISINLDNSLTLYRFAYEDDGQSIQAGQTEAVPEPSSFVLSALTACAFAALVRRRRNSKLAA